MAKFLIGYEIAGHMVVDAVNSAAASATAIGIVAASARNLEAHGENEYRCPAGRVINVDVVTPAKRAARR